MSHVSLWKRHKQPVSQKKEWGPIKSGQEVTVIISSRFRNTVFAIMFFGLLVSKSVMTAQLILSSFFWPTCVSESESAVLRMLGTLGSKTVINSRHCLQGKRSIPLHSDTLQSSHDLILQVDWKLKPQDQDWIRRLLTMSAFCHLHWSQMGCTWKGNLRGSAAFFPPSAN